MIISKTISWIFGKLVNTRFPKPITQAIIKIYIKIFDIDLSCVKKSLAEFQSLGEFFTRELNHEARPLGDGIVSPTDGVITEFGGIEESKLIQAKGVYYSLKDLLIDETLYEKYKNGSYICIYLSPKDYHRIHSPAMGFIKKSIHVYGSLLPVNKPFVKYCKNLYIKNERIVADLASQDSDSCGSDYAIVMVGALNVGSISTAFNDLVTNRSPLKNGSPNYWEGNHKVKKGDLIGTFHMGSTVILISSKKINFNANLTQGSFVLCKSTLGFLNE